MDKAESSSNKELAAESPPEADQNGVTSSEILPESQVQQVGNNKPFNDGKWEGLWVIKLKICLTF